MRSGTEILVPVLACLMMAGLTPVSPGRPDDINVRVILHPDGSRTVSKKDLDTRVVEQLTYSRNDALLLKRIYQLDAGGKERRGFVFDGYNNLLYRIGYVYDEIDRLREEVLYNTSGQIVRRQLHEYDATGRPRRPKALTFVNAPAVAGGFTPEQVMTRPGDEPGSRVMSGSGMGSAPGIGAGEPEKKKGFFKKLFGKKDKKK